MLRQAFMLVLLSSTGPGTLHASDCYLGVYARMAVGITVEGADEKIGFAPMDTIRLHVSVGNEEGGEELFLDGGIGGALQVDLLVDGEPQEMALSWAKSEQRYAVSGDLPPEPSRAGVLEPGVGLNTELTLRRRDGSPFAAGRYEIRFGVEPQAVTFADGSSWVGRGGAAGERFELRDADSAEARLLALKIRASDALYTGLYQEAAELFTEVVELDAEDVDDFGWSGLGVTLFHLGEHRSAAEILEKLMPILTEKAHFSTYPLMLAESYVALGEIEKAQETLRLVVVEHEIASMLQELQLKVAAAAAEK